LVDAVSVMFTAKPVAVVMVKPEAEVDAMMPVEPPSAGPDSEPPPVPVGGVVAAPAVPVAASTSSAEASPAAAIRPRLCLDVEDFALEDPVSVDRGSELWVCSSVMVTMELLSGTARSFAAEPYVRRDPSVKAT
jgi:hypothetical protein